MRSVWLRHGQEGQAHKAKCGELRHAVIRSSRYGESHQCEAPSKYMRDPSKSRRSSHRSVNSILFYCSRVPACFKTCRCTSRSHVSTSSACTQGPYLHMMETKCRRLFCAQRNQIEPTTTSPVGTLVQVVEEALAAKCWISGAKGPSRRYRASIVTTTDGDGPMG